MHITITIINNYTEDVNTIPVGKINEGSHQQTSPTLVFSAIDDPNFLWQCTLVLPHKLYGCSPKPTILPQGHPYDTIQSSHTEQTKF